MISQYRYSSFFKRVLTASFSIMLFGQICIGQNRAANEESFMILPEDDIKGEIAFFNIKASQSPEIFPKIKVKEIPLVKCTEHSASFSKGSIGVYIHSEKFDTAEYKSLNEIFWGTANKTRATVNIHDGETGDLLWKYDYEVSGSVGSSASSLSDALMRNMSKHFPYKKEK